MLLVTGITGHSGRYFLQELINNNYEGKIRCVVRKSSDTSLIDGSGLNIEKIVGDLNNQEFLDESMIGVDTVMHIYNIHHSPMIVQAAIKNDVKRVILVHTTGIYSKFKDASQEYKDIEKKVAELTNDSHCQTVITIIRPTMIYGDLCDRNISKFIKMVDKLRIMPVINRGSSLLQPVNARDLGRAYFDILLFQDTTAGKAYNLSGERPITMLEMFKLISDNLGKKTTFVSVPLSLGVFMAKCLKVCTLGKVDFIEKVQRMGEDRSFSHDVAARDFGYNPMPFKDGIKNEVQQYLNGTMVEKLRVREKP
jgi:nucleoside-diphosphate-sugar epimerase